MRLFSMALTAAVTLSAASAAIAAPVPDGTVTSAALFTPTVNMNTNPGTYSAMNGGTFEIVGTGGFAGIGGTMGTLNGTLLFSNTVGTVLPQNLVDFFVFSDAKGGTYNFSTTSVQTNSFINNPGVFSSSTLYVLGNLIDSNLNYLTPTPASLTLQFNSTGGSPFSSSLTLAVPPAGVPEPATWAMLITGFGLIGGAMRRRSSAAVRVSYT